MFKFNEKQADKKYRLIDVAKALGLSEGAVKGYFTNRKISTKSGLTLEQIYEVVKGNRRGSGIRWDEVKEIRRRLLERYGVEVVEENNKEDE